MDKRGNGGVKRMEQGGHIILTQEDVERILREARSSRTQTKRIIADEQRRLLFIGAGQYSVPQAISRVTPGTIPRATQREMIVPEKSTGEKIFWAIFIFLLLFSSAASLAAFVILFGFIVVFCKVMDGIFEGIKQFIFRKR